MEQHKTKAFNVAEMEPAEVYKLMAGSIIPRPIAWVSTIDATGVCNLAPYSFFTAVSSNPPTLLFCPAMRAEENGLSATKDTLENVRATGEFVVNIVSDETAEAMNQTAAQLPPGEDEFAYAGLTPVPSTLVRPPRVAEAKVHMECRVQQIVEIGDSAMGSAIVIGRVVQIHVSEAVLEPHLHIAPDKLRAVGRLSGSGYVHTTDRFELKRPR